MGFLPLLPRGSSSLLFPCLPPLFGVAPADLGLLAVSKTASSLNFPKATTHSLMPGAKLGTLSFGVLGSASVAPCALPSAPLQLQGNTLPQSKTMATVLYNNWLVHILLSSLSTKALLHLGASMCSQLDSDQSLSVKEGVLTVSAPHLDSKAEGLMMAADWSHAWPRLVNMICRYLLGEGADEITSAWCAHFKAIYEHYNFFRNF
ncbi:hypothetical protein EDB19DRAFT_1835094 [Suillus lakei]|nr:hypothetical protein EDB19DRAFT_1835094 [Suillus lakei]